jgi:hypothetical protein
MTDNKELEAEDIVVEVSGTSKENIYNIKKSFNDVVKK